MAGRMVRKIGWLPAIMASTYLIGSAGPARAQGECPCLVGPEIDNICDYGPSYEGCPAAFPGGYCVPNRDGDFRDGDWNRGFYEYIDVCSSSGSRQPDVIVTRVWIAPSDPEAAPIGWSYHGCSQFLVKIAADEGERSWTFRYRQTRSETGLSGIFLILTEGGQDTERNRRNLIISDPRCEGQWGWQCRRTSPEDYMDWLAWFDG